MQTERNFCTQKGGCQNQSRRQSSAPIQILRNPENRTGGYISSVDFIIFVQSVVVFARGEENVWVKDLVHSSCYYLDYDQKSNILEKKVKSTTKRWQPLFSCLLIQTHILLMSGNELRKVNDEDFNKNRQLLCRSYSFLFILNS